MGRAVRAAVAGILIGLFVEHYMWNGSTEKIIQREKQRRAGDEPDRICGRK